MTHSKSVLLVGLLSGLLVHCGGKSTPEPETAEPPPADMSAEAPPPAEPAPAAEAASEPPKEEAPPEPKPEPLTDEQIAMYVEAAHTTEVDQAKLAQKKAKNNKVKKFASTMVQQHTQGKQKHAALVKKLKITPAESSKTAALNEEAAKALETLKGTEAPDFDKAYIEAQVDAHKKVLDTFDTQIMPNVKNEDLKKSLEDARAKIEAHLKDAQDIQAALAAEPAPAAGGAAAPKSGTAAAPAK